MNKLLIATFLLSCALSAVVQPETPEPAPDMGLDMITMADQKHKSWCTVKAWWKYKWCVYKPKGANWKETAVSEDAKRACNITYNFDLDACNLSRQLQVSDERQQCLDEADRKEVVCKLNPQYTLKFCASMKYNNVRRCPAARRLQNGLLLNGIPQTNLAAQQHKSWCSFKAWAAKQWRKKNKIFKSEVEKAQQDAQNNAQYNADLAVCATRSLMRKMEKAIKDGNAHESWCSFKNRMGWIGCKSIAAVTIDANQRKIKLANCDEVLRQKNAACQ